MYETRPSFPERSGAVTLTASLTAALLGAVIAMSRAATLFPAEDIEMQVFDVAADDARYDREAPQKPAKRVAGRQVIPATAPAPVLAVARKATQIAEAGPMMPVIPLAEATTPGQPAESTSGIVRAPPSDTGLRPAATASKAIEQHRDADLYGRAVFGEIHARQTYPVELARAGLGGTVVVELRVSPRGRIFAVAVVVSSEIKPLDRLALAQVRSTPLPPPPGGRPRTFQIAMTYRTR